MGRRFIPLAIVTSLLAFVVAAGSVALAPEFPRLWPAAVALVTLGGITPLIYSVNVRVLPVFSRRTWQSAPLIYAAIVAALTGAWFVFAGRASGWDWLETAGAVSALAGGLFFCVSVIRLFRSPVVSKAAAPLPFPEQGEVDRIGTRFTRLSSYYLLFGLVTGLMLTFWSPDRGRWDLVWAHALLVGWFLSMASGIAYHVLPRWTSGRWRRPRLIQVHLRLVELGLPFMVLALALGVRWLFFIAGPLQAAAVLIFLWNIVPLVRKLPGLSRLGVIGAAIFLGLGVSLGASMAVDPDNHAILRHTHAQINLFGWSGLLISGIGYYLFPRLAGQPLRWPLLAKAHLIAQMVGIVVSATAWWWYLSIDRAASVFITGGSLLSAAGFLVFAVIIAATFRGSRRGAVASVALQRQRARSATLDVSPRTESSVARRT